MTYGLNNKSGYVSETIVQYGYTLYWANYYADIAKIMPSTGEEISRLFMGFKEQLAALSPVSDIGYSEKLCAAEYYFKEFQINKSDLICYKLFHKKENPSYYSAVRMALLKGDTVKAFFIAYQAYEMRSIEDSAEMRRMLILMGEKLQISSDLMHSIFSGVSDQLQDSPHSWLVCYLKGGYYFRQGNLEEARSTYLEVFNTTENQKHKWMFALKVISTYLTDEEREDVFLEMEKKNVFESSEIECFLLKAELEELFGWRKKAYATLEKGLGLVRPQVRFKMKVAQLYLMLRSQDPEFKRLLESTVRMYPRRGRFWQLQIQRAYLHEQDKVEYYLKKALSEAKMSPEVHCEYARFQLCVNKNAVLAKEHIEHAIEIDSSYGDAYIEWARILLFEKGMGADLSIVLNRVVERQPKRGILWNLYSEESFPIPKETFFKGIEHLRSFETILSLNSFLYENLYKNSKERDNHLIFNEMHSYLNEQKSIIRCILK